MGASVLIKLSRKKKQYIVAENIGRLRVKRYIEDFKAA